MILKPYIDALDANRFEPTQITDLPVFAAKYQGLSLFQHFQKQANCIELMNASLLQFAKLLDKSELHDLSTYMPIFVELLFRMGRWVGQHESTEKVTQIMADPDAYFYFLSRSSKAKLLRLIDYMFVRQDISSNLRDAVKKGQIARLTEKARTWDDLSGLKGELENLSKDPVFATHTSYSGWALQSLSQALQQLSASVPSYPTSSSQYFIDAADVMGRLTSGFSTLSPDHQKQETNLLLQWIDIVPQDLQVLMGERLDAMIKIEKPELISTIVNFLPENSHSILPLLSKESVMILSKALCSGLQNAEEIAYCRNLCNRIENATVPQDFSIELSGVNQEGNAARLKLAHLLVLGNCPQVSHLTLRLGSQWTHKIDTLFSLMQSEKIVLGAITDSHAALSFMLLFGLTRFKNNCAVNFLDIPQLPNCPEHKVIFFAKALHQGGETALRIHSGLTELNALPASLDYVKYYKSLPEGFSIYHLIPLNNGQSFDLVITSEGPKPGPLTKDVEKAMSFFNQFKFPKSAATGTVSLRVANFTGASSSSSSSSRSTHENSINPQFF